MQIILQSMCLKEYEEDETQVEEFADDEDWKVLDAACILLMDVAQLMPKEVWEPGKQFFELMI